MNGSLTFEVTEDHRRLLRRMCIGWEDCEYGAPAVDCKRPYGNSGVTEDICEILGWDYDEDDGPSREQADRARAIHEEMQVVLQILVNTAALPLGQFVRSATYSADWSRALPHEEHEG